MDEVEFKTEVHKEIINSDDGRIEGRTIPSVPEGVFVHGLYMEGAAWHKTEKRLEDSAPKELFFTFPLLHMSAESTTQGGGGGGKGKMDDKFIDKSTYNCPIYKYPKRTDKYLITRVRLKCEGQGSNAQASRNMTPSMSWQLKGVVLLCQKD